MGLYQTLMLPANVPYVVVLGTFVSYSLTEDSIIQHRLRERLAKHLPQKTPLIVLSFLVFLIWVFLCSSFALFASGPITESNHAFMAGFTVHAALTLAVIRLEKTIKAAMTAPARAARAKAEKARPAEAADAEGPGHG